LSTHDARRGSWIACGTMQPESHPLKLRATLLVIAILAPALRAQQPAAPAQPTFRSGVELVELDAIVTDAQGNVVTDLTASDFEISEAGKPQAIATFSLVNIPIERGERPLFSPVAIEPDVQDNSAPEGRLYVIALDEVSPVNAVRARSFLRRFVEQHLGTNDLTAIVMLGRGRRSDARDFTANRRLLLQAIDRFTGFPSDVPVPPAAADSGAPTLTLTPEQEVTATSRMIALRDLMNFMATIHGRRKTVLLLSEGLGVNMFNVVDATGATSSRAGDIAREAMRAALRGNVVIYPIDPKGLAPDGGSGDAEAAPAPATLSESNPRDSLRAIAEVTGGFAVVNSNNFEPAFDRIVRENSTYYILGYYSTNDRRDGRYRRLQVRVKRPGLTVRARDGYLAPTGRAPAAPAQTARSVSRAVADALASPLATPGLPMKVFAAPYRAQGRDATIAVAVEIAGSGLELIEKNGVYTGQVEVAYAATSDAGKVIPGDRHTVALALKPDTYERVRRMGLRVLLEPRLAAGRYQLRVAAANIGGRAGSVVYDLEVPDFSKDPLTISGVSLTSAATSAIQTTASKSSISALLPGPITATREFATGDRLALFAEIYDNVRGGAAHNVELRAELRTDEGRVVNTVTEERSSTELQGRSGGYGFLAELPLADASPGLYVIHVEARANIAARPTVSRDIQIRVRGN
jgi:VWFA-related protein